MSPTHLPAHGCPFCGHDLDKIHRVQSTTACWVACSACGARGPSADDMDDAVRAWNRYPRTTRRLRNRPDADPITDLTFTHGVLTHPWTVPEGKFRPWATTDRGPFLVEPYRRLFLHYRNPK